MNVRIQKNTYELPVKTMAVNDKFEQFDETRERFARGECKASDVFREEYDLVSYLLGEEATAEILHAESIDEIDLTQLELALLEIKNAYDKPLMDRQVEMMKEPFKNLERGMGNVSKVLDHVK